MKFNNFKIWLTIIIVILFSVNISFSQNEKETNKITKYLESTIDYTQKFIVNSKNQPIIKANIFDVGLKINMGNGSSTNILKRYFFKTKKKNIAFNSVDEILVSEEFIANINKNFKLKTEQNAIDFQTVLGLIDSQNSENGFFQKDNDWYFIRKIFFSDVRTYKVTTNKKGEIISVNYIPKLEIEVPESVLGKNKISEFVNNKKPKIEKTDSLYLHNFLLKNANYKFDVFEAKSPKKNKITNANFYSAELIITQKHEYGTNSSVHSFTLMNENKKYTKYENGKKAIRSNAFLESIKKDFKLKSNNNAKSFQDLIDAIDPLDESDSKFKQFYLKDDICFFIRDESFGKLVGFKVKINPTGEITNINYGKIKKNEMPPLPVKTPNKKVIKYLESTINYIPKLIISSKTQKVLKADVFDAELNINIGNAYSDNIILFKYFLKTKTKNIAFGSESALLSSQEFAKSINKKFRLTSEEDGISFQTILSLIRNEEPKHGFFEKDNNWYFITSNSWGDASAYKVSTNKKGKIDSINYISNLKIKIPELVLGKNKKSEFAKAEKVKISKSDRKFIHEYLLKNANYKFETTEIEIPRKLKMPDVNFYSISLFVISKNAQETTTSTSSFSLIKNKNTYSKCSSNKEFFTNKLFLETIKTQFRIKTKKNAEEFQQLIDVFIPLYKKQIRNKKYYFKNDIWYFVREKNSDELSGFMILTDSKGNIKNLDYGKFNSVNTLRLQMKNPNFKVDYKFKLQEPKSNKIIIKEGQSINTKITFDVDMVNAKGCWISTNFNDKNVGMYASTTMESPYNNEIPAKALKKGNHILEYFLIPNGQTDNELAKIIINIEVK